VRNFILAVMLVLPTVASAQKVFVLGAGQSSCGSFIAASTGVPPGKYQKTHSAKGEFQSEILVYQQWMYGFITAINLGRIEADQIRVDNAAVDLWMRNYCNKYPTDTFSQAAAMFVLELSKK
jgi:hypothetical protein